MAYSKQKQSAEPIDEVIIDESGELKITQAAVPTARKAALPGLPEVLLAQSEDSLDANTLSETGLGKSVSADTLVASSIKVKSAPGSKSGISKHQNQSQFASTKKSDKQQYKHGFFGFKMALLAFVALVGIGGLAYSGWRFASGTVSKAFGPSNTIELNLSHALDSPIGLLPGFENVKSGTARVTIAGASGLPQITKDMNFSVQPDGTVAFDVLSEDQVPNGMLRYLATKNGSTTFDQARQGATRYMTFDFISLFGLQSLTSDYADDYNGLLAAYESKTSVAGVDGEVFSAAFEDSACKAAASSLKELIGMNALNTQRVATGTILELNHPDGSASMKFSVEPVFFADIDTGVQNFVTSCYTATATSDAQKSYLSSLVAMYLRHPVYDFTVTKAADGQTQVIIESEFVDGQDAELPEESIRFQLLDSSMTATGDDSIKEISSFKEYPNVFALAYVHCGVTPVVGTDAPTGKYAAFHAAASDYPLPSRLNQVYACRTDDERLREYQLPTTMSLSLAGRAVAIDEAGVTMALRAHDAAYSIELHRANNGSYPTVEQVEAAKLPDLRSGVLLDLEDKRVNVGALKYAVDPIDCTDCTGYVLSAGLPNGITLNFDQYGKPASFER